MRWFGLSISRMLPAPRGVDSLFDLLHTQLSKVVSHAPLMIVFPRLSNLVVFGPDDLQSDDPGRASPKNWLLGKLIVVFASFFQREVKLVIGRAIKQKSTGLPGRKS